MRVAGALFLFQPLSQWITLQYDKGDMGDKKT